jgi:hypothetical protein
MRLFLGLDIFISSCSLQPLITLFVALVETVFLISFDKMVILQSKSLPTVRMKVHKLLYIYPLPKLINVPSLPLLPLSLLCRLMSSNFEI